MNRPYSLPHARPPQDDETLASLVTRNAGRYGFTDPMLVLTPLGLSVARLDILAHARPPEGLETLLGVDAATIRSLSSWHDTAGMARVGGRDIRRGFVHVGLRRSCPACLTESLHHRAIWDVPAITVCPWHGGILVTACPGCGRPPRWRGGRLERCGNGECSFDLRRDLRSGRNEVPVHVAGLHALYGRGVGATLPGLGLDFGKAVEVAFVLGSHIQRTGLMGSIRGLFRQDPVVTAGTMAAGWDTLADWPQGFDRMLDGLRGHAQGRRGRYGLRREFGDFAKWLSAHVEQAWSRPFQEAFAAYLVRQSDLRTTSKGLRRFGSPDRLRHLHMTLTDAAAFLGVAQQTMLDLADREDLYLVRPAGGGAPSLLCADRVRDLKERQRGTLSRGEAAEMLGVGVVAFRKMLKAGLLDMVAENDRVTHYLVVARGEVEGFIRRVHRCLEQAPARGNLVPLQYAAAARRDLVDILRAVLAGRLQPRALRAGEPGLRSLLFDSLEVEEIVPPLKATLSLVEAAQELGADIESVREWAQDGYLPTLRSTSRYERGDRVTEQGLRQFRTNFITSVDVGKLASTTGRWTAERLRFLGQPPLPSASPTGLYRRTGITADIVALVRPRESAGRAASVREANDLVDRVGADVGRQLGLELRRARSGFSDLAGRTYLQVIVGRRQRNCSKYVFRFNPGMRTKLEAAENGGLALALAGFDSYVLVPWMRAEAIVGRAMDKRHWLGVEVDAKGHVQEVELNRMQRWLGLLVCDLG